MLEDSPAFGLTDPGMESVGQKKNNARLILFLKEYTPYHMKKVKEYFAYFRDSVTISQFVAILAEAMEGSFFEPELIQAATDIFELIDIKNHKVIKFSQFTTFLVEAEEMLNRDESLSDIKLIRYGGIFRYSAEQLLPCNGSNILAFLDSNHRTLHAYNISTMKEFFSISVGSTIIITVLHLTRSGCFILSSNDKHLNVYDPSEKRFLSRFLMDQLQSMLAYSPEKKAVYSSSSRGKIYEFSEDLLTAKKSILTKKLPQIQVHKEYMLDKRRKPFPDQEEQVSCMICVDDLELLVTGSHDKTLRLYNNKRELSTSCKKLRGHGKQIKDIVYCKRQKHLVSCSFDFDVLVWNVYLDHPVSRLSGHQAPLLAVLAPDDYNVIISLDSSGIMKVWSAQNLLLLQTLSHSDHGRVKSITYREAQGRVILAFKHLVEYQFHVEHYPELTDDSQICSSVVSEKNGEIYVVAGTNIKVWELKTGVLKSVFKNTSEEEAVCASIDDTHRRMFVGTHRGSINIVDLKTGFRIGTLAEHAAEVNFLAYSNSFSLVISTSWDRSLKIHNDTTHLQLPQKRKSRFLTRCAENDSELPQIRNDPEFFF